MTEHTTITGEVIRGDGIGGKLGYPTANIDCAPPALEDGVYAAFIWRGTTRYNGMMILGDHYRDTRAQKKVELYLLDFSGDLYGENLRAEIVEIIRPFKQFTGTDALIAQIERDCRQARNIFKQIDNANA